MTVEAIRVSPSWLDLREAADGAARARELVGRLRRRVPVEGRWSIHDLACGSGSMGRWLAPLLPGPQRWVLHDRDADLLAIAAANMPGPAADGAEVAVETRVSDVTQLRPDDFAGATLITASALLDLLTLDREGFNALFTHVRPLHDFFSELITIYIDYTGKKREAKFI